MNKLNVVLLKLPTLYEILVEIKSELNFNIIHFSEKNVEFKKFISKDPNVLIISSDIKVKYNNFISYRGTVISKNKFDVFQNYKVNYFSPTSFIKNNEIIKHNKIKLVTFKKKSLYISIIKSKLYFNE